VKTRVATGTGLEILQAAVVAQAPGRIKESVRKIGPAGSATDIEGAVVVTDPAAAFVVSRIRPHAIRGRTALFWKGGPHPVLLVHHPGHPPDPFVSRAFDEVAPVIARLMEEVI
jgi:hypothetical protein